MTVLCWSHSSHHSLQCKNRKLMSPWIEWVEKWLWATIWAVFLPSVCLHFGKATPLKRCQITDHRITLIRMEIWQIWGKPRSNNYLFCTNVVPILYRCFKPAHISAGLRPDCKTVLTAEFGGNFCGKRSSRRESVGCICQLLVDFSW